MNKLSIDTRLDSLRVDLLNHLDDISLRDHLINNINKIREGVAALCQEKETLSQQVVKQKTWDQKEENPVVPQEQESSIHSNDQKLLEKEQSQRTVKTSKQYIITYPPGQTKCLSTGMVKHNCDIADMVLDALRKGEDVTIPTGWKVQVIDL